MHASVDDPIRSLVARFFSYTRDVHGFEPRVHYEAVQTSSTSCSTSSAFCMEGFFRHEQ